MHLWDDIQLIENNYNLKAVRKFSDIFHFVLKPSKPVSNFFLAWGQWWGHGMVGQHRILSLLLHAAVVFLLYANLHAFRRRLTSDIPRQFPFWVALLFALAPIHTEAIGVTWFRMDILGALFTLSGMLSVQKIGTSRHRLFWFSCLFLSLGLATFSKETFAFTMPVAVLITGWVTGSLKWRGALAIGVAQTFWVGLLLCLLTLDAQSEFPYDDVIGLNILEVPLHLRLAASALFEGIYKTLSGHGLTIVRLQERVGLGIHWGVQGAAAFISLWIGVLGWLYYCGGFLRVWGVILGASSGIYLAIPNMNIGSERYWYFPAASLFTLLIYGIWCAVARFSRRPVRILSVIVLFYAVALGMGLESRVSRMFSRERFYRGEWKRHPEAVATWSDMATVLTEQAKYDEAEKFIKHAKEMDATHPNVLMAEFLLDYHRKNLKAARVTFARIQSEFKHKPQLMGLFHFHIGILEEKQESPAAAARSYLKAMEADPKVNFYQEVYEKNIKLAKGK